MRMTSQHVIQNIKYSDGYFHLTPFDNAISEIELTRHSDRCQVSASMSGTVYVGYGKTVIEAFEDLTDNIASTLRRDLTEISIGFHQYLEAKKSTHSE